jgi:hypothetical protein
MFKLFYMHVSAVACCFSIAEGLTLVPAQTLAANWTDAAETYRTALARGAPADALVTLALAPPAALPLTKNSTPLVWQLKGKWQALVKAIRGGTKAAADREGGELSDAGKQLHADQIEGEASHDKLHSKRAPDGARVCIRSGRAQALWPRASQLRRLASLGASLATT